MKTNMQTILLIVVAVGIRVCASELEFLGKPPTIVVWFEDNSIMKVPKPQLIVAVWDSNDVIWSTNTIYGGEPYLYGKACGTTEVSEVLDSFQEKKYFSSINSRNHMGPDSRYIGMFVSAGSSFLFTRSWHEIMEQNPNLISLSHGVSALDGRKREDVLKEDKAEYLQYRAMWSDIRGRIGAMLPQKGRILLNVMVHRGKGKVPPTIVCGEESGSALHNTLNK